MLTPALFQILSRASWLLVILVSTVAFIVSIPQQRRLQAPRVYLGYCALASAIQFIIWLSSSTQSLFWYWFFEIINSIVLFIAAVELLRSVVSKVVMYFAVFCSAVVAHLIGRVLLAGTTMTNLEVNLKTLLMIGVLLTGLVNPTRKKWTRELRLVFVGIVLMTFSNWISSWLWIINKLGTGSVLFSQLSPLPGLILFALARKKKNLTIDSDQPPKINLICGEEDPKFENKLNKSSHS